MDITYQHPSNRFVDRGLSQEFNEFLIDLPGWDGRSWFEMLKFQLGWGM